MTVFETATKVSAGSPIAESCCVIVVMSSIVWASATMWKGFA